MVGEDSLTETENSFFDIYSTRKVTSTYNSLLEKLRSANNTSQNKVLNVENEEKNEEYSCKDTRGMCLSSPASVEEQENDIEIIPDNSTVIFPTAETPYLRRSARLKKDRRNQVLNTETNHDSCFAGRRKKSKRKKGKNNAEIIELSDNELCEQETNTENLSLDDEVNYEVSVKVVWKSVLVKTFRLRKFQKFSKVFEHFMEEEKVPLEQILLKVNNIKINVNDTPDSLNLKVCDFIEGGTLSDSISKADKTTPDEKCISKKDCLTIKVQDETKNLHKFSICKNESLKVIMMKYAEQIEIPLKKIKFYFDGEVLNPEDTPDSLEMENDEIIDVKNV